MISNRSRHRAPNLTSLDRFVFGLTTLFISPHRIPKLAAILKPATLLKFHKTLVDRKYHLLFSASAARRNPGPKGPSAELIAAIVEMKSRNLKFGYLRIAQQISHAFSVAIDKDTVRRVLAKHYRPNPSALSGPFWLAFFAQSKDSLFSVDLSDATGELSRSRCSSSSFFRSAAETALLCATIVPRVAVRRAVDTSLALKCFVQIPGPVCSSTMPTSTLGSATSLIRDQISTVRSLP